MKHFLEKEEEMLYKTHYTSVTLNPILTCEAFIE